MTFQNQLFLFLAIFNVIKAFIYYHLGYLGVNDFSGSLRNKLIALFICFFDDDSSM